MNGIIIGAFQSFCICIQSLEAAHGFPIVSKDYKNLTGILIREHFKWTEIAWIRNVVMKFENRYKICVL